MLVKTPYFASTIPLCSLGSGFLGVCFFGLTAAFTLLYPLTFTCVAGCVMKPNRPIKACYQATSEQKLYQTGDPKPPKATLRSLPFVLATRWLGEQFRVRNLVPSSGSTPGTLPSFASQPGCFPFGLPCLLSCRSLHHYYRLCVGFPIAKTAGFVQLYSACFEQVKPNTQP